MSYADVSFAVSYFGTRLHTSPWDNADNGDRVKALTMATRDIDRLDFAGSKAVSTQENEFPRGQQSEVPEDIKIACCEIALALLDGVDPDQELDAIRMRSNNFVSVKTVYDTGSVPDHILSRIASATAWAYLRPYLREPRNVRLSRVS